MALVKAEDDAVKSTIKLDATLHYPADVISALAQRALAVAKALNRHPGAWHSAFKHEKG